METSKSGDAELTISHETDVLTAIVSGLEQLTGKSMEELPRVGTKVNVDALMNLINGSTDSNASASFKYQDMVITVNKKTVEFNEFSE